MGIPHKIQRVQSKIKAEGWQSLPRWAGRWLYWNGRLYHFKRPLQVLRQAVRRRMPRRMGDVRFYQEQFPATADAFIRFLSRCEFTAAAASANPVGVIVTPWLRTPMPWYMISLAIGLRRRGRQVTLIWDDTVSLAPSAEWDLENREIGRVLGTLEGRLPVLRLSRAPVEPTRREDSAELSRLAELNRTWITRARIEPEQEGSDVPVYERNLARTLVQVRGALAQTRFEYLVVPGGIYGSSGLFRLAAGEAGIRAATIDANVGVVQVATEGIAAQQTDIPKAFEEILRSPPQAQADMIKKAQREFERRVRGKDRAAYQAAPPRPMGPANAANVLIPLNVEFDSAALGTHVLFENTVDWVVSVTSFVLGNSQASITIRQHPAERRPIEKSRFDLAGILQERFGDNPRLRFIAAEAPVNTYDLVQSASLILPHVSTIGVEAAAMGKPVIIAGSCYYSNLGFVRVTRSRQEYFDWVALGLQGKLPLLPGQCDRAWLCYYLTPVSNRLWTDWTPQPADFAKWCRRRPDRLYGEPEVKDLLTAVDENRPLSLVRHRQHGASL